MNNVVFGNFGNNNNDGSFSEWGWTPAVLKSAIEYKDGEVILPAGTQILVDVTRNIGKYNFESFHLMPDEYELSVEVAN